MAKMKNYSEKLADTPFPTARVLAEYLKAHAEARQIKVTTGEPAVTIEATDEAYAAALDAYERDTGTGKHEVKEVELREEPRQPKPMHRDDPSLRTPKKDS